MALAASVIGLTNFSYGQAPGIENQYRLVKWSTDKGLSNSETYMMIKDVNGFLWVGTRHGLNRFDGSTFNIYYHDPHDSPFAQ